jgi:nitroreductase
MTDIYQERYLKHQENKKETIESNVEIDREEPKIKFNDMDFLRTVRMRSSQRIFNNDPVTQGELEYINYAAVHAPSSCNRQAIHIQKMEPTDPLVDLLVGGAIWAKGADTILFLYADMDAYKSPNEVDFMPYLDAGFVAENIYLMCDFICVGCCFINPNAKESLDKDNYKFVGAIALGHYDKKAISPKKRVNCFKEII